MASSIYIPDTSFAMSDIFCFGYRYLGSLASLAYPWDGEMPPSNTLPLIIELSAPLTPNK